jgi:hypothetical protein
VEDCKKLTVEACTHTAQNERHLLRVVLQVLFFEQLQLWRAITGTFLASTGWLPQQQRRAALQQGQTHRYIADDGDAGEPSVAGGHGRHAEPAGAGPRKGVMIDSRRRCCGRRVAR